MTNGPDRVDPPYAGMVVVTVSTTHPEKWELIDHDENKHWVIRNGSWWQLYEPFETKDVNDGNG